MTKRAMLAGAAILWATGALVSVRAVEIARWNSTGSIPLAGTFAPTSQHANVTVSNLVTSLNLLRTGSNPAGNTFAAAGYSSASSNGAMAAGHYWETVIQADDDYAVSLENVRYRFRRPSTGPQWAQWSYSLDGANFTWLSPAYPVIDSYSDDNDVDLSGIPALQNTTIPVWFRMYAWGGGAGATAWGVYGRENVLIFSGTVIDAGPVPPTVWFNPPGAQSVAVSNELSLTVSATPEGSGIQSWSMAPAYSGSANLTGGIFTFTPAGPDNGKVLTLSVVATNSVGASTGTVSITVTPYVVPVPVITFHPVAPYSIMATETQQIGISVTPSGSGIQGWSLTPDSYEGVATLVGTNFTFATAEADGPETYTLSVVATNVHGATTGTAEIAVSQFVPAPPPGSVVVDFEDAAAKTTYAPDVRTLSGRSWLVGGVIGTLENDKKFGDKALRVRGNAGDDPIKLRSETPFNDGIESISLWYASYGNDSGNMPKVSIQISTALDGDWITLDTIDTGTAVVLTSHVIEVKVKEPVYFRLWAPQAGTDRRANFDNIVISPYELPTGYEAYLLSYNVTPGDPGTAPEEDLDGDGHTNQAEYLAGTNPYDPDDHP